MDEETFIRVHLDVTQVKKTMCNAHFVLGMKKRIFNDFKILSTAHLFYVVMSLQCLNAVLQSSNEFSLLLMSTTQTLCLKELHLFVQE